MAHRGIKARRRLGGYVSRRSTGSSSVTSWLTRTIGLDPPDSHAMRFEPVAMPPVVLVETPRSPTLLVPMRGMSEHPRVPGDPRNAVAQYSRGSGARRNIAPNRAPGRIGGPVRRAVRLILDSAVAYCTRHARKIPCRAMIGSDAARLHGDKAGSLEGHISDRERGWRFRHDATGVCDASGWRPSRNGVR